MYQWESWSEMIAELLREGCILDVQDDEENGPLVTFNLPVLEVKYPDVAEVVMKEQNQQVDEALNNLVDMGLLEMSFQETEDGGIEAVYSVTDAGKRYIETMNLTDI